VYGRVCMRVCVHKCICIQVADGYMCAVVYIQHTLYITQEKIS
jgi:hypothetical protein